MKYVVMQSVKYEVEVLQARTGEHLISSPARHGTDVDGQYELHTATQQSWSINGHTMHMALI